MMMDIDMIADTMIVISGLSIPLQMFLFLYSYPTLLPFKYRAAITFIAVFVFACAITQLTYILTVTHILSSSETFTRTKAVSAVCSLLVAILLIHLLPEIAQRCQDSAQLESSMAQKIVELDAAYHAAEQARMNKREFMAFLAHELRNPLHVITANVDFMAETNMSEEQRDYNRSINDNAKLMASIVNDVLDISRLQAGRMTFEHIPVDLQDLTSSLLKNVRHQAANKEITLILDYASDAPWYVISDPTRLHQIMLNLVSNSIKFTPAKGKITISIRAFVQNPYANNDAKATTTRLKDAAANDTSTQGKKFVSAADGDADLDIDEEHSGTSTIPAPAAVKTNVEATPAQFSDGNLDATARSSASSEDDASSTADLPERKQFYMQFEVRDSGVGISSALMPQLFSPYTQAKLSTVREHGGTGLGLSIVHQIIKNMRGHIHVHSRMGHGSVFTITLRLQLTTEVETQILRESNIPTPPQQPREVGNAPATPLVLKDSNVPTATQNTTPPSMHSPTSAPSPLPSPDGSHDTFALSSALPILVVDDNEVNRKILSRILTSLGYRVALCCDGLEAVNAVKNRDPADPFLCVLMDISMPVMDGYEATRHIRANKVGGEKLYIIALTANAVVEERRKANEAGMNDFVTKPIRKAELNKLLSKVQTIVPMRPRATSTAAAAATSNSSQLLIPKSDNCTSALIGTHNVKTESQSTDETSQQKSQTLSDNAVNNIKAETQTTNTTTTAEAELIAANT